MAGLLKNGTRLAAKAPSVNVLKDGLKDGLGQRGRARGDNDLRSHSTGPTRLIARKPAGNFATPKMARLSFSS